MYINTQIVVWLCEAELSGLTRKAAQAIETGELVVSPMVLLELEYLHKIQRVLRPPMALISQLPAQIGLVIRDAAFESVIRAALFETWTRDPFDRVIVAQAKADGSAVLVSSDLKVRENYPKAIW